MAAAPKSIRFFFDYISTNAYIAWHALPEMAARHGAVIEPVPVLFAGLLESTGLLGPAEVPIKARWMWRNNLRKAARLGLPLNPPRFHPFNPLLALRISSLPMRDEERARLIGGLFAAVWVHGQHVSEPDVVARVANEAGLDGSRLVADAQEPEAKARLRRQTDDAIAAGVFGVPSMGVGDEVFWGYDDFPYLDTFLAGDDPLPSLDAPQFNTAPVASAMRKQVAARRT
ncbi:MAG TPA: 2-hydroxychromene-2-carboxylate isomerase [Candidatus Dormibacteraeota bacterium]|nr:2-hydroxychromene-2-carboxylate isomerase [Candidatus Dormibacteraeota bacterium]